MLLLLVTMSMCVTGCDKNDDPAAISIEGDYSGKLQIVGYTQTHPAYVTMTKRSELAVSLVLDCDELDFHLSPVILDIEGEDNSFILTSGSKAVSGSVIGSKLSLTLASGNKTYTFYGDK